MLLRILQIGLGSMGRRRIRGLLSLGFAPKNIHAYDTSAERRAQCAREFGVTASPTFQSALSHGAPECIIISTPPHAHSEYFLYAARHKIPFLCEVTTTDKGYSQLIPLLDGSFVAAPSCTFRYFPAVKKIKKLLGSGAIGNVYAFTYHIGQYLPDWHSWEDYRKVYFSKKATGGCREMFVYEMIWLTYVLGKEIALLRGVKGKVSDLQMSADDVYSFSLITKGVAKVIGSVTIDLLSRTPRRTLRLIGSKGTLDWDWKTHVITIDVPKRPIRSLQIDEGTILKKYVTPENMYIDELKLFLDAIKKKRAFPYTFKENHALLKKLYEFEHSR